jgi:hypothetical protein
MSTDSTPARNRDSVPRQTDPGYDPVAEASEESFPASDAPAWTPVAGVMTPTATGSKGFTLTFSREEKELLLTFLQEGLKEKEVEVHRTDSLEFKELLEHEAQLMEGLINRLRRL